jgi:hypothetical protein
MSEAVKSIAKKLGAKVISELPETGGGAFGAARLAELRARLRPQVGLRPGRPTENAWSVRRKIPMSPATYKKLQHLASKISNRERKVSPMQLAAQLLEQSLHS